MTARSRSPRRAERPSSAIRIVYEDQSLVVVDKPAGMPSVSPRSVGKPSAWSALRRILEARGSPGSSERSGAGAGRRGGPGPRSRRGAGVELYLIHRLDQPASGLLVFAKSERARAGLKDLLAARRMSRRYAAVVEGRPREEQGEIRSRLVELEGPTHPVRSLRKSDGAERRAKSKAAVTRWRLLAAHAGRSALEVELETGRKHQIRVHLAEAGMPVAGDRLYGRKGSFMGGGGGVSERPSREEDLAWETSHPAGAKTRLPARPAGGRGPASRGSAAGVHGHRRPPRLLLHAWKLAFQHPVTRRKLELVSPPGPEFEQAVPGAFRTS